jgi:hypothetical protein
MAAVYSALLFLKKFFESVGIIALSSSTSRLADQILTINLGTLQDYRPLSDSCLNSKNTTMTAETSSSGSDKSSKMLNNLSKIGFGLGLFFPLVSIIIDLIYRDFGLTMDNLATIYKTNPLHWIILSAPVVLSVTCYMLGKRIAAREHFLQTLTETEKQQSRLMEDYVSQLANGNFTAKVSEDFQNQSLAGILASFRDKLNNEKLDAERRQWTNEGLTHFGDILRTHGTLEDLSFSIVNTLATYLRCTQAGLFVIQEDEDGEKYLELKGCYAYERKRFLTKRVEAGEGLLGQCFLEKNTILLYEVPPNYVTITSGLGQATPDCLVLCPLKTEDSIEGVVEIAGFRKLEAHEVKFLEKVCENTASVFKSLKTNDATRKLLMSSQEQTEMMRSQEEEMRQNMEELSATQEEMLRKEKEFTTIIKNYKEKFGEIHA